MEQRNMMRGPIMGSAPIIKFASGMIVVVDGNSLIAGQGGAQNIPRVLAKTAPLSVATHPISENYDATPLANNPSTGQTGKWQTDKGIIVLGSGTNGETWRKMNGLDGGNGAADVDAIHDSTKTNVLIAWEGTNSIVAGRTPAQAIQDATDYLTARKLAGRWSILLGTCLPRQGGTQDATDALNANIDAYNTLLRAQYRSMGAQGVFDVRQAGSAFNLPNYLMQTFEDAANAAGSYWAASETGAHTHLNSNGYDYVAKTFILPALQRLHGR